MMKPFDKAMEHVFKWEGGYVNDPRDPGGETKYGISKRAYPVLDIASLTKEDAKSIYKRDYWDKVRGDNLPEPIAIFVFDTAVNQGVFYASTMLQNAVGALPDGIIGLKTLDAVKRQNIVLTLGKMSLDRSKRYIENKNFTVYGRGWLRRMYSCLNEALTYG